MSIVHKGPSLETLRALETAPNMYLVLSPDFYILTASDCYLEAIETERMAIIGKHIFEAFPPRFPDADGIKNINDSLQVVLRTKKPHSMPIQRYDVPDQKKPGEFIQRFWDPSHTPILDDQGDIKYIIQLATNVTQKVLAKIALEKAVIEHEQTQEKLEIINKELEEITYSERHFRQLADLVPAKISTALPNGKVNYFNKQWLDYTKLTFEEIRDFGYYQIMHPDEVDEFQLKFKKAALKGVPLEMELRFLDANGDYRWHLNIACPILDDDGKILMWVCSTTDIGRIKEEEQRKTDFIGMVSHELKTPLTSLSAYLQMAYRKISNAEDPLIFHAMTKSLVQVKKMTTMIKGFLNVSRLESGKMLMEKHVFDMAMLSKEIEEEVSLTISSHQVIFAPVSETLVCADRDKIGHVINNFISNAVKYSPLNSLITVACDTINGQFKLSVRDEGIGVAREETEKLFSRFYRVEGANSASGFGIGLYLCAEILRGHNGQIGVESELGKGSTFWFKMPLADQK